MAARHHPGPGLARGPGLVVASEIDFDFDSTLVAASEEAAAAPLVDDRLEVLEVGPRNRLDWGGDLLNPPLEG